MKSKVILNKEDIIKAISEFISDKDITDNITLYIGDNKNIIAEIETEDRVTVHEYYEGDYY